MMNRTRQLHYLLCILAAIFIVLLTVSALLYREDVTSRYSRQEIIMSIETGEYYLRTEVQNQNVVAPRPDIPPTALAAGALRFFEYARKERKFSL